MESTLEISLLWTVLITDQHAVKRYAWSSVLAAFPPRHEEYHFLYRS